MSQTFTWDEAKAERNLKKHDVSFSEAATVFSDPLSLTIPDPLHSEDERRFVIVGLSYQNRLLIVVHTDQKDSIRIISARPATPAEKKNYEEGKDRSI